MIIACLLDPSLKKIDLNTIDDYVPDCGASTSLKTTPRVFKEHSPKFHVFPKVIYNYRDGRDCLVSAYRYGTKSLGYPNDRLHFVCDRKAQIFGFWHEHVEQALAFQKQFPNRILMVRYEDIHEQPLFVVSEIAQFLDLNVETDRLHEIIQITSFEQQKPIVYTDIRKKHTLGKGVPGTWKDELEQLELELFEGMAGPTLTKLGYSVQTVF